MRDNNAAIMQYYAREKKAFQQHQKGGMFWFHTQTGRVTLLHWHVGNFMYLRAC